MPARNRPRRASAWPPRVDRGRGIRAFRLPRRSTSKRRRTKVGPSWSSGTFVSLRLCCSRSSEFAYRKRLLSKSQNQKLRTYFRILPSSPFFSAFSRRDVRAGTIMTSAKQLSENSRWMGGQLSVNCSCLNERLNTYKWFRISTCAASIVSLFALRTIAHPLASRAMDPDCGTGRRRARRAVVSERRRVPIMSIYGPKLQSHWLSSLRLLGL